MHYFIAILRGRNGNCRHNSVAENFFGLIKREFLNHYRFDAIATTNLDIFNYINNWYNPHRIHSKLRYISSDEFEAKYLSALGNLVSKVSNKILYTETTRLIALMS